MKSSVKSQLENLLIFWQHHLDASSTAWKEVCNAVQHIHSNQQADPADKGKFYPVLHNPARYVPVDDNIIILGDFNVRAGQESEIE